MSTKDARALGLFGVLVLASGILMGVLLVRQDQNFRNKAKEVDQSEVTICHRNSGGFWEEIKVTYDQLKEYIDSGDILGKCPVH